MSIFFPCNIEQNSNKDLKEFVMKRSMIVESKNPLQFYSPLEEEFVMKRSMIVV
jgi:hypothetical protein